MVSGKRVSVPSRGFNSHYTVQTILSEMRRRFRPLSGIQFSLQAGRIPDRVSFSEFPSPLGDSILITVGRLILKAGRIPFPSPLGDSILITEKAASMAKVALSFRPLSGIQFSLRGL